LSVRAYLKSFLFGIGAAIVAAILWILAVFVLPIFMPFLLSRVTGAGGVGAEFGAGGVGGVGASIGSGSILAAAFVGFVAGFYWKFRRVSNAVVKP
jgi:hypothetical protein